MGMFNKKKKKNTAFPSKPTTNVNYAPPTRPAPQQQQQQQQQQPPSKQVIKIVGEDKHITTERIDAQGRKVVQTQVVKLTQAEKQQFGIGQPAEQPAPKKKSPPQHHRHHQQQDQHEYEPSPPPATAQLKAPPTRPPPPSTTTTTTTTTTNGGADAPSDAGGTQVTNISFGDESLAKIEITRELVKKFISDIWNRGEVEIIPQVCHPSLRFNGHVGMDRVGHDGFARMVTTVREALTDYHCEIHSMVVESNKAFCRLRFTGKHTGNLLGYPPTGKTVSWMGASEFTCKNGKILKVWELGDVKSLEDQLRSDD
jgi:steroid delta-isomerase-like uncharacterized protein